MPEFYCQGCDRLRFAEDVCEDCLYLHCDECPCVLPRLIPMFQPVVILPRRWDLSLSFDSVLPEIVDETSSSDLDEPEIIEVSTTDSIKPKDTAFARGMFTLFFMGSLFAWSHWKEATATDPFASAGKYRPAIRGVDSFLNVIARQSMAKSMASSTVTDSILDMFRKCYLQRHNTAFSVAKMVANPTPMPFTSVFTSRTEFVQSMRLTAFLTMAKKKSIESFTSDLLPVNDIHARKIAAQAVKLRTSMFRASLAGGGLGFLASYQALSYLPLDNHVMGYVAAQNALFLANAYSLTVGKVFNEMKKTTPNTQFKLQTHVETFMKQDFKPILMQNFKSMLKRTIPTAVFGLSFKKLYDYSNSEQ